MFDMARCNAPTLLNMGFPETATFKEVSNKLQCFPKLPDLEITPIPVHNNTNTYSKEIEDVMQRKAVNCEKKSAKSTKEQRSMTKLLNQLPILDAYFNLHQKIGEGTYSSVYLASYKNTRSVKQFAIKHLTDNVSFSKIQKELRYMQIIGGQDNVVNVLNCFKSDNKDCVVFVMPYLSHRRFSDYVLNMDVNELRFYMKNLFIALRRVHSFNVIHRDVKPGNFLYNRTSKEFLLVDFGLAQDVDESLKEKNPMLDGDGENTPINYSKRKRSSTDDSNSTKKVTVLSPLKSRENIMSPVSNNQHKSSPNSVPYQTCEKKRKYSFDKSKFLSKSSTSSCNSSKFFTFESPYASSGKSLTSTRRETSLGTSLLKCQTENKLASTPKDLSSATEIQKSFTPLIANKVPNGSFVQVRNSQVVAREQTECACSGTPAICSPCAGKRTLAAPRAGTPGFRPPEVLLKYLHQTTAVDMWAAGVVLLCVLSGCYPFFKSPSDLAALIEIISIFGTDALSDVALQFGRKISCSEFRAPLDLKKMCRRLRARRTNQELEPSTGLCNKCHQSIRGLDCVCKIGGGQYSTSNHCTNGDAFPEAAYHLLSRLLDLNPVTRITATEALDHPFISQI